MIVSILGCGWYGKALAKALLKKDIVVNGSATSAEKLDLLKEDGIRPYLIKVDVDDITFDLDFFKCDILIISIPPKLRKSESAAYLPKINNIIQAILQNAIQKVIYISSTGVYGDQNNPVTEADAPNPDPE